MNQSENGHGGSTADEAEAGVLAAVPGMARIAASAWWRTATWTAGTSVRASVRVVRAAASGESPGELFQETGAELRDYARRVLGMVDLEDRIRSVVDRRPGASPRPAVPREAEPPSDGPPTTSDLRLRGEELLRRSADVRMRDESHPAYARILTELAPDEARILRLLAVGGPQPAVDVRTAPLLIMGSELVAPGLSMIGAEAGCRHTDRIHPYLTNLFRLGLIWFSREPLTDTLRYQVLEAQPEVVDAMRTVRRARTVRRSIHLTPFGEDFCRICLPLETAEIEALTHAHEPFDPDSQGLE